jgi:hypothetical protein
MTFAPCVTICSKFKHAKVSFIFCEQKKENIRHLPNPENEGGTLMDTNQDVHAFAAKWLDI